MHRMVRGSADRTRTCNLILTDLLLLPKGLDYLMSDFNRTRVYSLYTFNFRFFLKNLARDCPPKLYVKEEFPELARFSTPIFIGALPNILTGIRSTIELPRNDK